MREHKQYVWRVYSFLGALLLSATAAAITYNGHDYTIVGVGSGYDGSWAAAEMEAVAWGGHLVTINDKPEQDWLRATFGGGERLWIGFTDQAAEGTWLWITGEPVTFTDWNEFEPNNSTPPDYGEDYAVLNWDTETGQWNDWDHLRSDYSTIRGIAEKNLSVPDVGSTIPLLGLAALGLFGLRKRVA
jgi:hypothetical protein